MLRARLSGLCIAGLLLAGSCSGPSTPAPPPSPPPTTPARAGAGAGSAGEVVATALYETSAQKGGARAAAPRAPLRRFALSEGPREHRFLQQGDVSAHFVLTKPPRPRLVFAFPAGNSGAGIWPAPAEVAALDPVGELAPWRPGPKLRGAEARIRLRPTGATVRLVPLLDSVRALRDYMHQGSVAKREAAVRRCRPQAWKPVRLRQEGKTVVAERAALDGVHHYRFEVLPGDGVDARVDKGAIVLTFRDRRVGGEVTLRAAQDFPPLTPLADDELFADPAAAGRDPVSARALRFLAYREKLLAGSWQYLTYFGRDSLLSARLLRPVLGEAALRAAIVSVLERLSPEGDVAHEEDIGDQAAQAHLEACPPAVRAGRADLTRPVFDYKMVDDDLMLLPLVRDVLLGPTGMGHHEGPAPGVRLRAMIGERGLALLARNIDFVLRRTAPFVKSGRPTDLIRLLPKLPVGDWRDSEKGLGGGRFAASVNTALAPSALEALRQLVRARALPPEVLKVIAARDKLKALGALLAAPEGPEKRLRAWTRTWLKARRFFRVARPYPYEALSLDAKARPIEVMHSDDAFILLDETVTPEELAERLVKYERRYPQGLMTPVGVVVANGTHSRRKGDRAMFGPDRYHGAVMWAWPELVLDVGLLRQLRLRHAPLPARLAARVKKIRARIADGRRAAGVLARAELRTWKRKGGRVVAVPFGAESGAETEANPVQLWSTLQLVDPEQLLR